VKGKNYAHWYVSLDITCPECDEDFDLTDNADFWVDAPFELIECDTSSTTDVGVICPHCKHEFEVDFVY
jgi:Zn finger protein HypA/HybF involved in hydrogenase expression